MFKFELNQQVRISASAENGEVIARAEFAYNEDQYLVRYMGGDGRAVEAWWGESALEDFE